MVLAASILTLASMTMPATTHLSVGAFSPLLRQQAQTVPPKKPMRVLIFSKTAGFRHDSIEPGVAAFRRLGEQKGFSVSHTEDATAITADKLKAFDVVMFLNTTGDIFNEAQQTAFEGFVRGGGGFVGIHSATDTEYGWEWYSKLVGAQFKSHPAIATADVHIEDPDHATCKHLPKVWRRTDEWYDFRANPRKEVHVLAVLDEKTYSGGQMGEDHPIMWCREFDGGRSWYTGMGHTKETFEEPLFLETVYQGLRWVTRQTN
jgi:type 1 glutamine amidotransferase